MGAERYASETLLSTRVSNWQNRLSPILRSEEKRKVFDIHEYGANVINVIEHTQQKRSPSITSGDRAIHKQYEDFHDVCSGLPMFEVCRFFLASLTLCNSGNILFKDVEKREHPSSPLFVQLLKNQIDRPTESYLTPSLVYDQKY
jgi:Condensin II complex subunit CAP-H2 or CNDH2, C-term